MIFGLFLQAQPGGDNTIFLFFMGLMFVVMYFFMIRPQQKKQKDAKKFREGIKKGDNIVTIGGIHGVVTGIESGETITVEIDNGVRVKIEKWAVSAEASQKAGTPAK